MKSALGWVAPMACAAGFVAWVCFGVSSPRGSIMCSAACGPVGMKSYTVRSNGCHDDTPVCECNRPSPADGGAP